MRLYREVENGDIPAYGDFYSAKKRKKLKLMSVNPDESESIYLLPIEITEEEIDVMAVLYCGYTEDDIGNDIAMGCLYDGFMDGAKAILSKLKGE